MNLHAFIAQTLREIVLGVTTAQNDTAQLSQIRDGRGAIINPFNGQTPQQAVKAVDFDIAVTVTENTSGTASGTAGISVLGISGEIEQQHGSSKVSRIRFQVPVKFAQIY